jgi:hypothetical protein
VDLRLTEDYLFATIFQVHQVCCRLMHHENNLAAVTINIGTLKNITSKLLKKEKNWSAI